ncbi:MAG: hypothetical protein WKF58_02765 [Ilumatobacteraceae bacterium]
MHAYALVGPSGSTKDVAARAFAAEVLVAATPERDAERTMRLASAGEHPDIHEFHRVGPGISAEQARDVVVQSSIAPVEGERKVLILNEFHLVRPEAAAILLKSIEEPPASTIFLICADFVPPELVTIASRCVRIAFGAVDDDLVVELLVAEGNDPAMARSQPTPPAATSTAPASSCPTTTSSSAATSSPTCRAASTAPARRRCSSPTSCWR